MSDMVVFGLRDWRPTGPTGAEPTDRFVSGKPVLRPYFAAAASASGVHAAGRTTIR